MKRLFKLTIIATLLCYQGAMGQTLLKGQILNQSTNEAISYATISIANSNIGVISDKEGNFELRDEAEITDADSIEIGCLGYETQKYRVGAVRSQEMEISLKEHSTTIEEVICSSKENKVVKIGNSSNPSKVMRVSFSLFSDFANDTQRGCESGMILKIKKRSYIKNLNIAVSYDYAQYKDSSLSDDIVKARVKFYSVEDNKPKDIILNRDIIISINRVGADKNGWISFDFTPYNIVLDGGQKVAVTLESVEKSKSELSVCGELIGNKFIDRQDDGSWKHYGSAKIYLTAEQLPIE